MKKNTSKLIDNLNNPDVSVRLDSLKMLWNSIEEGKIDRPIKGQDVNNHIHTTYSFSPYSPTKAIWMAYNAGLTTAGIMDHDSIAGAKEFIEAGRILGIATTIGVECRVDFSNTALKGRRINNPDQRSNVYMAIHGIPHTKIDEVREFFKPITKERNIRNMKMVDSINKLLSPYNIAISFEQDVVPLSNLAEGGSITERHILFALAEKVIEKYGRGEKLLNFFTDELKLSIESRIGKYLSDIDNPHYTYDLLGLLKSDLIEHIYIDATDECPDVNDVIKFAKDIGAISAYAYLGDVGESVTGDKKAQKFEDDYIELLFETIKNLGFNAVTYMPSRNTREQLLRVKSLCREHKLLEISGEDINSPRQSFICEALREPEFHNLIESTWALIAHEIMATEDINKGLFSSQTIREYPDINDRVNRYSQIGRDYYK
ncbi:MAG: PHP domain-containing protein [Clostridiales bacterium]|nr:PHP domain-containing protein [Clostridiales bacterium]